MWRRQLKFLPFCSMNVKKSPYDPALCVSLINDFSKLIYYTIWSVILHFFTASRCCCSASRHLIPLFSPKMKYFGIICQKKLWNVYAAGLMEGFKKVKTALLNLKFIICTSKKTKKGRFKTSICHYGFLHRSYIMSFASWFSIRVFSEEAYF